MTVTNEGKPIKLLSNVSAETTRQERIKWSIQTIERNYQSYPLDIKE